MLPSPSTIVLLLALILGLAGCLTEADDDTAGWCCTEGRQKVSLKLASPVWRPR